MRKISPCSLNLVLLLLHSDKSETAMSYQFGSYVQSPPSPPQSQNPQIPNHNALIPIIGSAGGGGGGGNVLSALNNNLVPSTNGGNGGGGGGAYRPQHEDKRLTREAMGRYMRDRNDMVIVILHAKVRPGGFVYQPWEALHIFSQ